MNAVALATRPPAPDRPPPDKRDAVSAGGRGFDDNRPEIPADAPKPLGALARLVAKFSRK
jgi:hypothetical protein